MREACLSLARQLGEWLLIRDATVTTAESCTGGGVAEAITAVPGSSEWFHAGFITYSNDMKQLQLGVSAESLAQWGAVSEVVVAEMAAGALAKAGAAVAVAVSGIAGPDGGSEEKPVGTVWFAWLTADGNRLTQCCHFSGDRAAVREQAVIKALEGLIAILKAPEQSAV